MERRDLAQVESQCSGFEKSEKLGIVSIFAYASVFSPFLAALSIEFIPFSKW